MFNPSFSKSNSSTRGTLHFTRQPRSCEVAPTLRQFHFQTLTSNTSDSSSPLFHFRCSSSHPVSNAMILMAISKICVSAYKYNKSMLHRPPSHLLKRSSCYRASWGNQSCLCRANARVYQVQVLIILSWRWSQCHAMSQVVVSWRLVALKVPCTSCFLGQYGRVSERRGGQLESCPCSSWLGATMACSGGQLASWFARRKTQISDGWTRKAGREWHQSQHVSTEHSDLSCLSKDEAFGNTCIVACLSLLHAHSAAKVSGSEFCNIQLACHFIPPCFTSVTLSESQHVSGSSWECVDPIASHYSRLHLGSQLDKQKSTNWLSWSVCYLQVERLAQRTL